jgi:hypothetical protein
MVDMGGFKGLAKGLLATLGTKLTILQSQVLCYIDLLIIIIKYHQWSLMNMVPILYNFL